MTATPSPTTPDLERTSQQLIDLIEGLDDASRTKLFAANRARIQELRGLIDQELDRRGEPRTTRDPRDERTDPSRPGA